MELGNTEVQEEANAKLAKQPKSAYLQHKIKRARGYSLGPSKSFAPRERLETI
jgi:hypothetical protein